MSASEIRFRSARRHLDVLEESWKADHAAAMACRALEEFIAEAVAVFGLFDTLRRLRREYVYRGLEEPRPELDMAEKDLYVRWLELVADAVRQLETLEKDFGRIEGEERLRASVETARSFLAHWTPALTSNVVGLRAMELTDEDADELRRLVDGPTGRPARPPCSLPTGDASLLR